MTSPLNARRVTTPKVVVADGGTISDRFEVFGNRGSYFLPAGLDGTSAQFAGSVDGTNFTLIGSAVTVSASGTFIIPADVFTFKYARIVLAEQTDDLTVLIHMAADG